jgi:hypothetical protein
MENRGENEEAARDGIHHYPTFFRLWPVLRYKRKFSEGQIAEHCVSQVFSMD